MKLILFDVDGTLTPARLPIQKNMLECLQQLKNIPELNLGFVGGSDLSKQIEQLGQENFYLFEWRFSENGLQGYHHQECIHQQSFVEVMTEEHYKQLINTCLFVLSGLECPKKRGTFIEYRNGMINISPIGRACNQAEREEFEQFDQKTHLRQQMISQIKEIWSDYVRKYSLQHLPELQFSIGGQISVDIFPKGWDKTYCLPFVEDKYQEIHFFGDKTDLGGNDYEIYHDSRVFGHQVSSPEDTLKLLTELFLLS